MIHRLFRQSFQDSRNETIWLTIYADLITNLMMMFLALYGLTVMGDDAVTRALNSMKLNEIESVKPSEIKDSFENIFPTLKKKLATTTDVTVVGDEKFVRIQFGEKVLFDLGGADLKESAFSALHDVASILKGVPYTIVVEGHTDNVPIIAGSRYRDNRELSLARSMSVVRALISKEDLPPAQFAAASYASYRPRASNTTQTGRRLNRRVEILLTQDFPYGTVPQNPKESESGHI